MFLVFEQVVGLYPKGGAVFTPGIADYYEIAEDGKTYTFHLNPNAAFHDGTPLTAADLVFTCDAVANEGTGTSYTSTFNATVGSYRAVDDHTFEVVTADVFAQIVFFPNFFAPVVPKHIWEAIPFDQWKTDAGSTGLDPSKVIGSGPFKFESLSEAEGTTTLVRNDAYYDDVPRIEKIIFQTWPDDVAIIEALRSGDVDVYLTTVPATDTESLIAEENVEVAIYDTYKLRWYGYNLDPAITTLFQDVKVRQALIHAIDRQSIIDNILLGYGIFPVGTQPVLSEAFTTEGIDNLYEYDVAKANSLLDEAGWALNGDVREKDGVKLSFDVMFASGVAELDSIAAAMQDYWKAVGVDGQPNPVDFDTVMTPALTETFDFRVIMLGFNWASPSGDQSAMFGTTSYGGGFNAMRYSNPEYDALNDEANRELDPAKRRELLIKASNIVNNDAPICTMFFRNDRIGYNARLKNFTPTANSLLWSLNYVEAVS
jgi:peptide/nickel transport system substrate-binding protein